MKPIVEAIHESADEGVFTSAQALRFKRCERNKATVRRFYESVNDGRFEALDELVTPEFTDRDHNGVVGAQAARPAFEAYLGKLRGAFSGLNVTVEEIIADGDLVAVRKVLRGTHQGVFAGMRPTERRVRLEGMDVFRLAGSRIVDYWHMYDGAELKRSLEGSAEEELGRTDLASEPPAARESGVEAQERERNVETVRYMHERIDAHDLGVIDEVLATDFVDYGAAGVPPTAEGIKMMYVRVITGLPDAYTVLHDVLADGETVVVRRTCHCTHAGEMWGIPASGRRVHVGLINWFRLRAGKIAAHWHAFDSIGLRQQMLGMAPQSHF